MIMMKNLNKFIKNRLFIRMFLYFNALLIPVIIVGSIFYIYSVQNSKIETGHELTGNLEFSKEIIENSIQMAVDTSLNLMLDDAFEAQLTPSASLSADQKKQFESIFQAITRSQNVSNYVIDNLFVFKDDQWILRSAGAENFDTFFKSLYQFETYPIPFWKAFLTTPSTVQYLEPTLVTTSSGNTKTVIPTVSVKQSDQGNMAVVVCLSTEAIYEMVRKNIVFSDTEFIVFNNKGNTVIASRPELMALETNTLIGATERTGTNEMSEMDWNQTSYFVTKSTSDRLGWDFFTLTPKHYFYAEAENVLRVTLWSCILLFLIGSIMSLIFSVKLYSPIRAIRDVLINSFADENNRNSDINLNKKNEFEIISSSLSQLMDVTSATSSKISRISDEYLDNAFSQLIKGHIPEHLAEFNNIIHEDLGFSGDSYVCCCILFDLNRSFYSKFQDTERYDILEGIRTILQKSFLSHFKMHILEPEPGHFACILNLKDDTERDSVIEACENIIKSFSYEVEFYTVKIGIGKAHHGINKLWISYAEAQAAIDHGNISGEQCVWDASFLPISPTHYFSFKDEEKVINCLKAKDLSGLENIIDTLLDQMDADPAKMIKKSALFDELYRTAVRYAADQQLDIFTLLNQDDYQSFKKRGIIQDETVDSKAMIMSLFGALLESAQSGADHSHQLVQEVIQYIEAHYFEDIYLERIATDLGISVKHLSRSFKTHTNINLTNYISAKRIEISKALLADSSMTIDEICQKVGIHSRVTFYRLFKKHVGTNPSNYRKSEEHTG